MVIERTGLEHQRRIQKLRSEDLNRSLQRCCCGDNKDQYMTVGISGTVWKTRSLWSWDLVLRFEKKRVLVDLAVTPVACGGCIMKWRGDPLKRQGEYGNSPGKLWELLDLRWFPWRLWQVVRSGYRARYSPFTSPDGPPPFASLWWLVWTASTHYTLVAGWKGRGGDVELSIPPGSLPGQLLHPSTKSASKAPSPKHLLLGARNCSFLASSMLGLVFIPRCCTVSVVHKQPAHTLVKKPFY